MLQKIQAIEWIEVGVVVCVLLWARATVSKLKKDLDYICDRLRDNKILPPRIGRKEKPNERKEKLP